MMPMVGKKSELSLQVVVVAAILLLVLVILTIIFATRMNGWNKGLRQCDTVCMPSADACREAGYDEIALLLQSCEDSQGNSFSSNAYCCKRKT